MKKYLVLCCLLSAFASSAFGQMHTTIQSHRADGGSRPGLTVQQLEAKLAFSVTIQDTQVFPADFGDHTMTGTITNLTDSTIYLNFQRYQDLKINWETEICFGSACLSSVANTSQTPFQFLAHKSEALIVHFIDTSSIPTPTQDTVGMNLIIFQVPGSTQDSLSISLTQIADTSRLSAVEQKVSLMGEARIQQIYPNPSSASLPLSAQVYTPTGGQASVAIYNLAGELLQTTNLGNRFQPGINVLRFSPAGLSSGAYMLRVDIEGAAPLTKVFQITR